MKKVVKRYLTENRFKKFENSFESNMWSIAKSFARVDESLLAQQQTLKIQQDVLQIMLKEITAIHEDTKSFKENIATLYTDHVGYDRKISNLGARVEKLELNNK